MWQAGDTASDIVIMFSSQLDMGLLSVIDWRLISGIIVEEAIIPAEWWFS